MNNKAIAPFSIFNSEEDFTVLDYMNLLASIIKNPTDDEDITISHKLKAIELLGKACGYNTKKEDNKSRSISNQLDIDF